MTAKEILDAGECLLWSGEFAFYRYRVVIGGEDWLLLDARCTHGEHFEAIIWRYLLQEPNSERAWVLTNDFDGAEPRTVLQCGGEHSVMPIWKLSRLNALEALQAQRARNRSGSLGLPTTLDPE